MTILDSIRALKQAAQQGKVIQVFHPAAETWVDVVNPMFNRLPHYYRVKPESPRRKEA